MARYSLMHMPTLTKHINYSYVDETFIEPVQDCLTDIKDGKLGKMYIVLDEHERRFFFSRSNEYESYYSVIPCISNEFMWVEEDD